MQFFGNILYILQKIKKPLEIPLNIVYNITSEIDKNRWVFYQLMNVLIGA